MNDLFVITGARGTGKSLLAATYLPPSEIENAYVHDAERSMNRVIERLGKAGRKFGYYADLGARFKDLPEDDDLLDRISRGQLPWVDKKQRSSLIAYYQYILDDLAENLEHGKYSVYIHDTVAKLEAGMAAWVDDHHHQAGVRKTAYGGLWTQGVYPLYEHLVASIFGRGVDTIILTSHLKTPWEGKRPVVGKVTPAGKKLLYLLSSFFVWLVNDRWNKDGAPAGLVLKERLGDLIVTDDDWEIRRMLPERIPHCTWKDINRYLEHGCDLVNPAFGERMSDAELGMISELVSDEQMRLMILGAEQELAETKAGMLSNQLNGNGGNDFDIEAAIETRETADVTPDNSAENLQVIAKGMADGGAPLQEIAEAIDRPVPVVRALLNVEVG